MAETKLQKFMRKGYEEAVRILAVSLGFVAVSVMWAIGISLILKEIYLGVIPLIIGYELARFILKFIKKYIFREMEIEWQE